MNERQIQIVGAQFLQAHFQARDHLARTELAGPHLGGQVNILAGTPLSLINWPTSASLS